jgi:magnesium-transporting ATPase (P-type)
MTIPREDVEKELTFLGFLVMQNKLKHATIKAL